MTTPKSQGVEEIELTSSIEELEGLIDDKAIVTINTHPAIPVLDEAIDPDDDYFNDEEFHEPLADETFNGLPDDNISREQLAGLIGNMEEKISGELDALVNILKDAIKESIITEIKAQLETRPQTDTPPEPDNSEPG